MSLNGSYTLSRCKGTPTATGFNQPSAGYLKPDDPSFDAGYCDQDRTHIGDADDRIRDAGSRQRGAARGRLELAAVGHHLPRVPATGSTSSTGQDNAFTGIAAQRPNKVSDDFYAAEGR